MRTLLIVDDNVELASLLAVVAEVHGFAPRVAHSGLQALELLEQEPPEAALVDLHLPDLAGQELLKAFQARGVPSFAMSGIFRGGQFARTAVETYGARAFFEKPFAARDAMVRMVALLNAPRAEPPAAAADQERPVSMAAQLPSVEALISKAQTEIAAQTVARSTPLEDDAATLDPEIPSVEALVAQQEAQEQASLRLELDEESEAGATAASAEVPPLDAMESSAETTGIFASASAPSTPPPVESAPEDASEPDAGPAPEEAAPEAETAPARPPPTPPDAGMDEAGEEDAAAAPSQPQPPAPPAPEPSLEAAGRWAPAPTPARRPEAAFDTPVPLHAGTMAGLLAQSAQRRATGELRIKRGEVLKVVGLREGQIVFAASNLSNERLPRWALRTGKLPASRVQELQERVRKGARTSDALMAMGLVAEGERVKLVASLVREIVWSLLDAEGGEAVFVTRAPPRKNLLPLALDPVSLVLRGYRQVFSLVRLRELVDPDKRFFLRNDPPFAPDELGLGPRETTLFAAADGSKTLEDLLLLSELEERDALVALVALTHLGVLEVRAPPRRRVVLG